MMRSRVNVGVSPCFRRMASARSRGLGVEEVAGASPGDPRVDASLRRNALAQTIGNLTVVTQPLNSAVSNGPWAAKKPAILAASLLPLNQQLYGVEQWDEMAIEARSEALF